MYIYNYFIILLGVCVSYDTQFDTIHGTEKSKINSQYDLRFDNYYSHQQLVLPCVSDSNTSINLLKYYSLLKYFDKFFRLM